MKLHLFNDKHNIVDDDYYSSQPSCPCVESSFDSSSSPPTTSSVRSKESSFSGDDDILSKTRDVITLRRSSKSVSTTSTDCHGVTDDDDSSHEYPVAVTPISSYFSYLTETKNEEDTHKKDSNTVYTNEKTNSIQNSAKGHKEEKKQKPKLLQDNMSWLKHTFCALPTMTTTLDTSIVYNDDEEGQEQSYYQCNDFYSYRNDDHSNKNNYVTKNLVDIVEYDDDDDDDNMSESSYCIHYNISPTYHNAIDGFFQNNNLICTSWEGWDDDTHTMYQSKSNREQNYDEKNTQRNNRYNNSSINMNTKRKKMEKLFFDSNPFDDDDKNKCHISSSTGYNLPIQLNKKSISHPKQNIKAGLSSNRQQLSRENTKGYYDEDKSCEWHTNVVATCGGFNTAQEIEIISSFNDNNNEECNIKMECLCYDSDPSDLLHQFHSSRRRVGRKPKKSSRRYFSPNNNNDNDDGFEIDDEQCTTMICEQMTTKRLLIWHNHSSTSASASPVAINFWIEQGSQLASKLIQPKLCWNEVQMQEMLNRNNQQNNNKLSFFNKTYSFHSIDLLDISKVIAVDRCYVDRNFFPFIRSDRSFIVEAFDGVQVKVFEARDEEERDKIVDGLKMTVARLSSKIIVGDSSVLGEFFSPYGSVPGYEPLLFQHNHVYFS